MKALVTGGTGLIGHAIAKLLVREGHDVKALVRDAARASPLLPPEVTLVTGDITDPASLPEATRDVEVVFHAAGMPEQWQPDESIFDRMNRQGTANVLAAARRQGVRRVVYTSSMAVFDAPPGGTVVESRVDAQPKETAYGRSKQAAESEVARFVSEGFDVVLINPSVGYGPSPVHVGLNSFFIRLLNRKAPLLPPGVFRSSTWTGWLGRTSPRSTEGAPASATSSPTPSSRPASSPLRSVRPAARRASRPSRRPD